MKNKKFTIGLTLLMAGSLFLTNCTKNKTNEAPSPDYETQSTKDMAQLHMILNDIIEIGGQANDGASGLNPYLSSTLTSVMVGTTNVVSSPAAINIDLINKFYTVTFANTPGNDGHVRNGQLRYDYAASSNSLVPQIFYRTPGYIANVTSTAYTIDNYSITINSLQIRNLLQVGFPNTGNLTPANYNLAWGITADITVTDASGSRNLKGDLTKTLLNTNNTAVPMPLTGSQTFTIYQGPGYSSLAWNKAYVSYSGTGVGTTAAGPFSYTLSALTRNFNSSPEGSKYITYVAPNPNAATIVDDPERHPFLSGIMTFKEGAKSTRIVDFGSGNVVDYNASVTIQGVTYDVDCKE